MILTPVKIRGMTTKCYNLVYTILYSAAGLLLQQFVDDFSQES